MARTRLRPRHWGLAASVVASVAVLLLATAVVLFLGWLALGRPAMPTGFETTAQFFEGLRIGLYIVAGLAAAVGLTVSYRKQRGEEEGAFTDRYTSAGEQLGHEKAAVRLAGVYALARLADDWEDQRQTCIDVLCAYIRMPYNPEAAPTGEREVRLTVISIIRQHLIDGAPTSWRGIDLDFTGATFDGGDFSHADFTGGRTSFRRANVVDGINFSKATFSGSDVDFDSATFSGGSVSFSDATFSDGEVKFTWATFSGGRVNFARARVNGGSIDFTSATFSGSDVYFNSVKLISGVISLQAAILNAGNVTFFGSTFTGGAVDFSATNLHGGKVSFHRAAFDGSDVSFELATFSEGGVSFNQATFGSSLVKFDSATFSGSSKVAFHDADFRGGDVDFSNAYFAGGEVNLGQVRGCAVPPRGLPSEATPGLILPPDTL